MSYPNKLLSIVIVTNNRSEDLKNLLDSIVYQDVNKELFEIVIVNNGDDIEYLITRYKNYLDIKYIKNPKNLGASKGRNIGVKDSCGEFILFLDDDNYLQNNNILKEIIEYDIKLMKESQDIGAIRYATEYPIYKNGKRVGYEYAVYELDVKTKKYCNINNIKLFKKHEVYFYLNHFATCGVLIRKEAFEKIGGFDENMFVYVEDIDLCIRLWINNYKVLLNPWIVIRHIETPKSRNYLWIEYQMAKNQILMLYKNFPVLLFLFYTIHRLTLQCVIGYKNLKNKDPHISFLSMYINTLKGLKDAFKLIFTHNIQRNPMSYRLWKFLRFDISKENLKILKEKGLL
ncbi:glycosyltransferase family 2 protein [Methanocaldococcus sp.]